MTAFVEVAVPLPVPGPFHYRLPAPLAPQAEVGCAVTVPFGNRRLTGYVLELLGALPDDTPLPAPNTSRTR